MQVKYFWINSATAVVGVNRSMKLLSLHIQKTYEPWHEISNIVVCATSKASDQSAHTRSLIRACASRLTIFLSIKLLTEHHLEFLSLTGGCKGSSESTLVKMPHCWKSHVAAHIKEKIALLLKAVGNHMSRLILKKKCLTSQSCHFVKTYS